MLMCGGSRRPRSHLAPRVQRSFRGSQRWESSGAPRRLWLEKTKSASGRRQYSEATISRRPAVERPVSWRLLLPNIAGDQKRIWSFPAKVVEGHHWIPTAAILGTTAGLVALDATEASYFRHTSTFQGLNGTFT